MADELTPEQKKRLAGLISQHPSQWPPELMDYIRTQAVVAPDKLPTELIADWVKQQVPASSLAPASPPPPVPVTFRITTYWKRKRGEPGPTQMDSRRLALGQALDWILSELPEAALTITGDAIHSVTTTINWDLVPPEIRNGRNFLPPSQR